MGESTVAILVVRLQAIPRQRFTRLKLLDREREKKKRKKGRKKRERKRERERERERERKKQNEAQSARAVNTQGN